MLSDDSSKFSTKTTPDSHTLTSYRFVIALLYTLGGNSNFILWAIYAPIQTSLEYAYGESLTYISFSTILISNTIYVPSNFIGNYIIDKYGLRIGTIIGSLLTIIGMWTACLCEHDYTYIFIGQIIASFGQPYFYATPQKFSNVWFGVNERPYSTAFMSASMILANSLGSLVPQWFVDPNAQPSVIKSQVQSMNLYIAIIASASCVLIVLFIREKPANAPSRAAVAQKYHFVKSLKTLLKDWNAMIMLTTTSVIYSTMLCYFTIFQQLTLPFGIDELEAGNIMAISAALSLIGCALGASLVNRYKRYNLVLKIFSVLSLGVLAWSYFAMNSGSYMYFMVTVSIFQILIASVPPVALEYGVELAFPVEEMTIGGIWFVINQTISTVESLVIDTILGDTPTQYDCTVGYIIVVAVLLVTIIPMFFVKEKQKRAKYEKEDQLMRNDSESMKGNRIVQS